MRILQHEDARGTMERTEATLARQFSVFASCAAIFAALVGLAVLTGWTLDIPVLLSWGAGSAMAPNDAACTVLAALSLWLIREERQNKSLVAQIAAGCIAAIALLTLCEQVFAVDLGIERILLLGISPVSSGIFLLLSVALLTIDWRMRRGDWPAQFLCLGTAILALFELLSLILGPHISAFPVAFPAALAYLALSGGLLCSRASWAFGGLLVRQSRAGRALRRALPASLLVLSLIGWVISKPLLAIIAGAMLAGFVGWVLYIVDRAGRERRKQGEARPQRNSGPEKVEQPTAEVWLRSQVKRVVAVAVILIGMTGLLSWSMAQQAAEDADSVVRTQVVSTTLSATLRHMLDVETGARGFSLTGERLFLEPYGTGLAAVAHDIEALGVLLQDPDQRRRLDTLALQARTTLDAALALVAARTSVPGRIPGIQELEQGKRLMDAARDTIEKMETEQNLLLRKRAERSNLTRHVTNGVIALSSVLGVIFLSIAGIILNREIGIGARAQAQIETMNSNLEGLIKLRTEALESSEERLRLMLDGIRDYAVYMLDLEGRVVSWNSGAARITGYQEHEVVGRSVSIFYGCDQRFRPEQTLSEAASNGRFESEGWRVRKDGSTFWANSVITPLYAATGDLRGYSMVERDITDRKQVEAALSESEARLAGVIDSAMDAIITVDDQQRIVLFNCAAEKMFLCLGAEAIGQSIGRFIPNRFQDPHTGQPNSEGDPKEVSWALRSDGREFPIEASISQVVAGGKKLFTVILRDISERLEVERTLHETQARMTGVVASAIDAIVTIDSSYRIAVFNAAAARTFGCSEAEALGQPIKRFIPRRLRPAYFAHIRQFAKEGCTNRSLEELGELRAVRADGVEFQFEASISQVEIAGRKMFTVILRDITDRRQAEEIRERLAAIVHSTDDAIISKTLDGTITAWNRSAERVFGYTAEEAIGRPMLMLMPPDRESEEADILARIRRGERVEHFETIRVRKDGRSIDISATISPVRDSRGIINGASKIARDITGRKLKEEALRESEERFRLFVEHAPAALAMFDCQMRYLHMSRRWRTDFGLSDRDLAGMSHYAVFPEVPERWKVIHRRALAGEVLGNDNDRFDRPGGMVQWIKWEVRPWYNRTGSIGGIVVFTEDLTDRHRAEEALRAKERLLSESQRIAHIGSWTYDLTDPSGPLTWSEELYRIYGVSPETFTPSVDSLLNLLVAQDRPAMELWMSACRKGEEPGDLEYRTQLPDGGVRFLSGRGELQRDAQNRPVQMVGTAQDITGRRAAEIALYDSEQRFEVMANGIPQLAWMAEADGSIFWYNRRWYEYTGTTFEDMQGWAWESVHDPAMLPEVLLRWRGAIATGQPFEMEFPLRGADGVFRTFLTRVMPLKDSSGAVIRWLGTNTDISERTQNEKRLAAQALELLSQADELIASQDALETHKMMLQSVVDSVADGLIATNQNGEFLLWNPAAVQMLGRRPAEVSPSEWSAHYGAFLPDRVTPFPADRHPLVCAIHGEVSNAEIYFHDRELDHGILIDVNGAPLRDKAGAIRGGVVAFRDITRAKAIEEEIRNLNEELEFRIADRTAQLQAINSELEAFTYSVSHDLRAPIRHVAGFAQVLAEDFGASMPPDARRYLQHIENGAQRMTGMVEDLLGLSRLGRRALKLRLTEMAPLVHEVIAVLALEWAGRDLEWRIAPLPALECDPGLMGQVFQNLLSNALKYSRRQSKAVIEIDTIPQPGKPPVFFVRDNGVGFDMKYADKLFGVFQRLHGANEFEGTGVGLATVDRIIKRHGGTIWAQSETGQGATFYFALGSTTRPRKEDSKRENPERADVDFRDLGAPR